MSRPISHRHGLFALSLPFGKIKIARNDLPEAAQFFFAEIIFCYDGVLQMGAAALKSGKTHKFFFCVGTIIDNFGSRLTMHGVMYLVLHFFEELYGNFGVRVVIYARCVFSEARISRMRSKSSLKYPPPPSSFSLSSSNVKPLRIYSLSRFVAHWRNCVPRSDFTR